MSFYMNYMEGGGAPTQTYLSREDAEKEAERLTLNFGKKVYTLAACTVTEPQPKVLKRELLVVDLPF